MLRRTLVGALLASTLALIPAESMARDWPLDWNFIIVWPNAGTNWTVDQGIANVDLKGNKFTASTKNGDFVLKGRISGAHVTATGTAIGTEMDPLTLHGDIQRARTRLSDPSNGWGWDRISLTAPGGFYVGLNRKVRSGAAPGETSEK
jgi:hypothetical protein